MKKRVRIWLYWFLGMIVGTFLASLIMVLKGIVIIFLGSGRLGGFVVKKIKEQKRKLSIKVILYIILILGGMFLSGIAMSMLLNPPKLPLPIGHFILAGLLIWTGLSGLIRERSTNF